MTYHSLAAPENIHRFGLRGPCLQERRDDGHVLRTAIGNGVDDELGRRWPGLDRRVEEDDLYAGEERDEDVIGDAGHVEAGRGADEPGAATDILAAVVRLRW